MKTSKLVGRNLTHYWRTNLAVVLGVATAVAVLAGAFWWVIQCARVCAIS